MMTLDRLRGIGRSTLPAGLYEAVTRIGNRPMRCRATIGGHLALKGRTGDLTPLLQLLETRVEIRIRKERHSRRKSSTTRRIPIALLEENQGLSPGELISRISIPTDPWDLGVCRKVIPTGNTGRYMIFAALARIEKEVLTEFRLAFTDGYSGILRDRDMEVDMAGRPLPLSLRELDILDEAVDAVTASWGSSEDNREYEKITAKKLARSFLIQAGR
jgi:CO/xanthine dehydrogenase FAD-binding subunit